MSDDRPTIRPATLADLSAIVAIYNEAVEMGGSVADPAPITIDSRLQWFSDHNPSDRPLLVSEMDGRIIAWAGLQSYSLMPAFDRTAEVSVYVSSEYRRSGHGAELLRRLLDDCPQMGIDVVVGTMFAHNTPVIKMNERLGFAKWGRLRRVARMDGQERDLLFMGVDVRDRTLGRWRC